MDKLFLEFEVFEMRSDELVAVACALVFSSCRNGELDRPQDASPASETRIIALRVGIDDCFASDADTRASYDDAGALIWSAGDAISVCDGTDFYKFELTEGEGTRYADFTGTMGAEDPRFAFYPYNEGHKLTGKGKLKFSFPSVYENYASGTSYSPFYAEIDSIEAGAHFVHLGATVRFKLNSLPEGVKSVSISTVTEISGESELILSDGVASLDSPDGGRTVVFSLDYESSDGDCIVLELPVLPGIYDAFSIDVRNGEGEILKTFNFIRETEVDRAHIKPYSIDYEASASGTVYKDNGIAQLVLSTPDRIGITSKDVYVEGAMLSLKSECGDTDFTGSMKVKGRGNTTWSASKKPYKIKFDKKQSLFGEPKDKEWVLLANHYDKSLIRGDLAYWMAREYGNFDYVPVFHFVDLILNGKYNGTYQLGDQVKIAEHRVNAGDDGFLLEIDAKAAADDITFRVDHIEQPVNIKEPDVETGDTNYNYVVDFVRRADAALFADNWLDVENGYKVLIDMESFVEWYLVMEITKNNDAVFFSSCYMNLARGGKLKMGPLWDFDVSMGGYPWGREFVNDPEGFYIKTETGSWIARLFQDPSFVGAVKTRFKAYYDNKAAIIEHLEETASSNRLSAIANSAIWGTLCDKGSSDSRVGAAYDEQVNYLENWLSVRLEWLNTAFSQLD